MAGREILLAPPQLGLDGAGLTMPPCALHFFSLMISHFLPPQVLSESLNRHERFLSCARRYTPVHTEVHTHVLRTPHPPPSQTTRLHVQTYTDTAGLRSA